MTAVRRGRHCMAINRTLPARASVASTCAVSPFMIPASGQAATVAPENCPEPSFAPTLAGLDQARMIWKPVVKTASNEPADRDVRLRYAHETEVKHGSEQEPRQCRTNRNLGTDPWLTVVCTSAIGGVVIQPARFENPVDVRLAVIVGNQLLQRRGDEQLRLGGGIRFRIPWPSRFRKQYPVEPTTKREFYSTPLSDFSKPPDCRP